MNEGRDFSLVSFSPRFTTLFLSFFFCPGRLRGPFEDFIFVTLFKDSALNNKRECDRLSIDGRAVIHDLDE